MEARDPRTTLPRAPDRRTVRTVRAIEGALRELLDRTDLDAITVTALCEHAGVKRQSFYTHFASVPQLAAEMLTGEIDSRLPIPDVGDVPVDRIEPLIVENLADALSLIAEHRVVYRAVLESQASGIVRLRLEEAIGVRVVNVIAIWQEREVIGPVDLAIAVPFAAGGIVRAIEAWATGEDTDAQAWARGIRDQMPYWWPKPAAPSDPA